MLEIWAILKAGTMDLFLLTVSNKKLFLPTVANKKLFPGYCK